MPKLKGCKTVSSEQFGFSKSSIDSEENESTKQKSSMDSEDANETSGQQTLPNKKLHRPLPPSKSDQYTTSTSAFKNFPVLTFNQLEFNCESGFSVTIISSLDVAFTLMKLKEKFFRVEFEHCVVNESLKVVKPVASKCSKNKVVVFEMTTHKESQLLEVIHYLAYIKIGSFVVLTNISIAPTKLELRFNNSVQTKFFIDPLTWKDFDRHVQSKLLSKQVKFQDQAIKINKLLSCLETHRHRRYLETLSYETLFELAENRIPTICKNTVQTLPKLYQTRLLAHQEFEENLKRLTETELVAEILNADVPPTDSILCLLGETCCGKTTLLHSIADKLRNSTLFKTAPNPRFVQYIKMSTILTLIEQRNITCKSRFHGDLVLDILTEIVAENQLVDALLQAKEVLCDFLLDGFDEIPSCYVEFCLHFLKEIKQNDFISRKIRVWMAALPQMAPVIENILQVKCYKIKNFSAQEQLDFVCKQRGFKATQLPLVAEIDKYKPSNQPTNTSLSEFEQTFIGTPFYCNVFAQSDVEINQEYFNSVTGLTGFSLFKMFINQKIQTGIENSNLTLSHTALAIEALFPQIRTDLLPIIERTSSLLANILRVGLIVELNFDTNSVVFMDRSIAEYFIAEFLFQICTNTALHPPSFCAELFSNTVLTLTFGCSSNHSFPNKFWHHDLTITECKWVPYFFECHMASTNATQFQLSSILVDFHVGDVFFHPKGYKYVLENLTQSFKERPKLTKAIVLVISGKFKSLSRLVETSEGCQLLFYAFEDEQLNLKLEVEEFTEEVDTPVKLIRVLIRKDVMRIRKNEYARQGLELPSVLNRNSQVYEEEIMKSRVDELIWLYILNMIETEISVEAAKIVCRLKKLGFPESRKKFEQYNESLERLSFQMKHVPGIISLRSYILAEFVAKISLRGTSIDIMPEIITTAVKVLLQNLSKAEIEMECANPFSFLNFLDEMLAGKTVKGNFIQSLNSELSENDYRSKVLKSVEAISHLKLIWHSEILQILHTSLKQST